MMFGRIMGLIPLALASKINQQLEDEGIFYFEKRGLGDNKVQMELDNLGIKSNIKQLYLMNQELTKIPSNIENIFPNLEELCLQGNKIDQIPEGRFTMGFTNLKSIFLRGNPLSKITSETFKGLENLLYLDLQSTDLVKIDKNAFSPLKSLVELNLNYTLLENINENTFEGLENLKILHFIRDQTFYVTNTKPFKKLTNLNELFINKVSRDQFNGDAFKGVSICDESDKRLARRE